MADPGPPERVGHMVREPIRASAGAEPPEGSRAPG